MKDITIYDKEQLPTERVLQLQAPNDPKQQEQLSK